MTLDLIRPAVVADMPAMHVIRMAVRENRLSDPGSISEEYFVSLIDAGTVWVAMAATGMVGFAAIDAARASLWALFVDPDAEGLGVGRALHATLIETARERRIPRLTLTTSPGTRAERFYRTNGWTVLGGTDSGKLRMERQL